MRRALLLALAALALLAPAAEARPFTPEAEQFYAEAVAHWDLVVVTSCPNGVERELTTDLPDGIVGMAPPCKILVKDGLTPCATKEIIFHETGHVHGLGHSDDPTNLMYPQLQGTLCVTPFPPESVVIYERYPRFKRNATLHAKKAKARRRSR